MQETRRMRMWMSKKSPGPKESAAVEKKYQMEQTYPVMEQQQSVE